MADNVIITAGSGTTVHADEYTHTTLGSGKTQLVKLVNGTLDSDTAIGVADIGAKANAIRVCPANDITDATYIGDIKFGEALPAGTNAIGKLAANTGVDIGDVDVLSIAAGDNNIGNVDIATHPSDTFAADAQAYGKGVLIQGDDGTDRRAILVDTDGHVKVDIVTSPLTKSTASVTDWTAVAQNTVSKSDTYDFSGCYESNLCIQAFLDTTTAHTGTELVVQTSSNTTGNEDWQDFTKWTGLVGTAVKDDIEDNPLAASSTVITLTAHTYTALGKWLAIEDATLVNSELIYEVAQAANSITVLDGTTNEHANTADIYNVAETYTILIPLGVYRARLIVNNTVDNDGSTLNYRVRVSKATGI